MAVLPYTFREGLAGFRRASFAAAAATAAMSVALVLVTVFAVAGWQAQEVASWLRQRVGEMEVFLTDVDDSVGRTVHARLQQHPAVAEAAYVSRDEAAALFREEFGEGAEAFFDTPFLPASVRVTLSAPYATADSLSGLATAWSAWANVDEVLYNQPLLVRVQRNLRFLTLAGSLTGLLVLFASIFLVANTIRLTVYARRLLIRTMKLVGATDAFIRRPFVIEGLLQGFVAGVVALGVLAAAWFLVGGYLPELGRPDVRVLAGAAAAVLLGGTLLGWLGSAISVRRFIRKVALH